MKFNSGLYNYSITMETFLSDFVFANGLGTARNTKTGECLDLRLMDGLNHYDIAELELDGIRRASWADVTAESILRGQILLVRANSWKGQGSMLIPYYRPQLVLGNGYACALQKADDYIGEEAPLPTSYDIRAWKRSRKRRR